MVCNRVFNSLFNLTNQILVCEAVSAEIGYNPVTHFMPEGTDEAYKQQYKTEYEARLNLAKLNSLSPIKAKDAVRAIALTETP